eukprot:SAG31_NODE_1834_length_7135_cov_6.903923_5_plen_109_part_00
MPLQLILLASAATVRALAHSSSMIALEPGGVRLRDGWAAADPAAERGSVLRTSSIVVTAALKLDAAAVDAMKRELEARSTPSSGKRLLSRFCAHYQRNTGLLSRDVTH